MAQTELTGNLMYGSRLRESTAVVSCCIAGFWDFPARELMATRLPEELYTYTQALKVANLFPKTKITT